MTATSAVRGNGATGSPMELAVAEFFAGVELARMGLEAVGFDIVWANDFDRDKVSMYKGHFGTSGDHEPYAPSIAAVQASDLPDNLSLAWASFPCINLSLAGWRRGMAKLSDTHSSTFWEFTRVMREMDDARPGVVLENVVGLATSRGGEDLRAAIAELNSLGYSVDVLTLDARRFVPQSHPQLFLVGAMESPEEDPAEESVLRPDWLQKPFNDPDLRTIVPCFPSRRRYSKTVGPSWPRQWGWMTAGGGMRSGRRRSWPSYRS